MAISPPSSDRRPDIQGLRAVAVLLVVLYHAGLDIVPGGYIGVDVFFIISGYLITGLLLREINATGRVDLSNFYARRIRRLLPAAILVLFTTMAVAWFSYAPLELKQFSSSAFATAVYLSNFWFAHLSTDYLGEDTDVNPLLHTWSLSAEEQFYIVWPLFLILVAKSGRFEQFQKRLLFGITIVCVTSLFAAIVLTRYNQPWAFFSSPTRAWEFGFGGGIAILGSRGSIFGQRLAWSAGIVGMALVLIPACIYTDRTAFPGVAAIAPVLGTGFLVAAAHKLRPVGVNSWLTVAPLRFIGDISYSVYLWHWPIFVFMNMHVGDLGILSRIVGVVCSLALGWLTYVLIENPIRFNKLIVHRVYISIAFGILLSGSAASVALAFRETSSSSINSASQMRYIAASKDIPRIYTDGCHANFFQIVTSACVFGEQSSDFTVVLFGDSHAAQWFPAVESVAEREGWRLVSLTKTGCPSVSLEIYAENLRRRYFECDEWRERSLDRIELLRPSLIIIANSHHNVPLGSDLDSESERAAWAAATRATLSRLDGLNSSIAIVRDTPRLSFSAPTCLSRAEWQGADPSRECTFEPTTKGAEAVFKVELAEAARIRGGFVLDLTSAICPEGPCTVERDEFILYHDHHHLTATFSRRLASEFRKLLLSAMAATHSGDY